MPKNKLTPAEELKALYRRQSDIRNRIAKLEEQEKHEWYNTLQGKAFRRDNDYVLAISLKGLYVEYLAVQWVKSQYSCEMARKLDARAGFRMRIFNYEEIPAAEFWAAWSAASKCLEQVRRQYGNGASGGKH